MRLEIKNLHSETSQVFEGTESEVKRDLFYRFPWLAKKFGLHASVGILIHSLNQTQAVEVIEEPGDIEVSDISKSEVIKAHLGHSDTLESALRAAAFLSGKAINPEAIRAARNTTDDPHEVALIAAGLGIDKLKALKAVMTWDEAKKSETKPYKPENVQAVTPAGKEFADAVRAAAESGDISEVDLGGVHSGGSLLAKTPENSTILLKPGKGQNSQRGAQDSSGSQPKRESAFYAASKILGIQDFIPETHLLLIDGVEYSAIQLLPWDFHDMNEMKAKDPSGPRRLLSLYLSRGDLHKWAAADYILGNPDRNAGNIMIRGDILNLIDHGSAFDGENFDPVHDNKSFVPYYLRVFVPNWADLDQESRFKAAPRVSTEMAAELGAWVQSIDTDALAHEISRYGIDPTPAVIRLQRLKEICYTMAPDLAINSLWTL
jgi:hypothetical protein